MQIDITTLPHSRWNRLFAALMETPISEPTERKRIRRLLPRWPNSQYIVGENDHLDTQELWNLCSKKNYLDELIYQIDPSYDQYPQLRNEDMNAFKKEYALCSSYVEVNINYIPNEKDDFYVQLNDYEKYITSYDSLDKYRQTWLDRINPLLPKSYIHQLYIKNIRDQFLEMIQYSSSQGTDEAFLVFCIGLTRDITRGDERARCISFLNDVSLGKNLNFERLNDSVDQLNSGRSISIEKTIQIERPVWQILIEDESPSQLTSTYKLSLWKWIPWVLAGDINKDRGGSEFGEPELIRELENIKFENIYDATKQIITNSELYASLNDDFPFIEFMVPFKLLSLDFDQIGFNCDDYGIMNDSEQEPLGMLAYVVIRSLERTHPDTLKRYQNLLPKWKARYQILQEGRLPTRFMENYEENVIAFILENPEEFYVSLVICYGHYPESECGKLLPGLIRSGIPISIWLRESTFTIDSETISTELTGLMTQATPGDLPEKVRAQRIKAAKKRKEPHIGHCLTLFWEDPTRLWPRISQRVNEFGSQGSPMGCVDS